MWCERLAKTNLSGRGKIKYLSVQDIHRQGILYKLEVAVFPTICGSEGIKCVTVIPLLLPVLFSRV